MKKIILAILTVLQVSLSLAQNSFNMDSLFNWQDPFLIPSSAHFNTYNEIWGYAKSGAEYAIIGSSAGTHIFDVTVPSASAEVEFIEGAVTGAAIVHRDYHDHDDYLYMVCDEGPSTLQIADLRFLPDSAPVVYDSDALFPRSHNIFIDTSSARMYVCGGTLPFAVYSLENPTAPTLLVDCAADIPFWSAIGYVHDTYVRGDTAYLNAGFEGLYVVDFSDLNNIQMLGSIDVYEQSGYNHSGWLMKDQPYYALADETHGMDVKILDVSDFTDMEVEDTIGANVHQFSIPHNLIYRDNLLFVSFYFDGLYVFDCTNPEHPILAGFYDTSTETHQNGVYRGCWGVYPFLPSGNILASDMQTGLWVFGSESLSGVEDASSNQDFNVYPNPTSEFVFIPAPMIGAQYELIDVKGAVMSVGVLGNILSLENIPEGLYLLKATKGESTATTRLIKR